MSTVYIRFPARPADHSMRAPLLESLLARAAAPSPVVDWRAEAFAVIAASSASTMPAVPPPFALPPFAPPPDTLTAAASTPAAAPAPAAAALCAAAHSSDAAWVCVATPVHLVAGMTQVTLSREGVLRLDVAQATVLAANFNAVFQDSGVRVGVGRDAVLLCVFERRLDVHTHDPDEVVGRDVFGHQPTGPDSTRLRSLMSEIEMWLFEHPINHNRTASGQPVVSGLWLWGGGPVLEALPSVSGWTAGVDPLFAAFGSVPAFPRTGRAGVVVGADPPGAPGWAAFETQWLAPAAASLRSGRVQRLELSAGAWRFGVSGRWAWRFWRRPRPWWLAIEDEDSE